MSAPVEFCNKSRYSSYERLPRASHARHLDKSDFYRCKCSTAKDCYHELVWEDRHSWIDNMSWSRVIGIKETKHQVKIAVDAPKSIRFMVIQIDRPSEEPSYRLFVPHSFDEQKKMFTGWAIVARNPYIIESCGYHTAFVVGNWSPSGRSYGFSKDDTVALYANIDESKLTDISYILE